jgi:hypothetical protein
VLGVEKLSAPLDLKLALAWTLPWEVVVVAHHRDRKMALLQFFANNEFTNFLMNV